MGPWETAFMSQKWSIGWLVTATLLVSGCSSSPAADVPDFGVASTVVTAEAGGSLKSADGRITLTIPPGAVTAPLEVTIERAPGAKAHPSVPAGVGYALGPDG